MRGRVNHQLAAQKLTGKKPFKGMSLEDASLKITFNASLGSWTAKEFAERFIKKFNQEFGKKKLKKTQICFEMLAKDEDKNLFIQWGKFVAIVIAKLRKANFANTSANYISLKPCPCVVAEVVNTISKPALVVAPSTSAVVEPVVNQSKPSVNPCVVAEVVNTISKPAPVVAPSTSAVVEPVVNQSKPSVNPSASEVLASTITLPSSDSESEEVSSEGRAAELISAPVAEQQLKVKQQLADLHAVIQEMRDILANERKEMMRGCFSFFYSYELTTKAKKLNMLEALLTCDSFDSLKQAAQAAQLQDRIMRSMKTSRISNLLAAIVSPTPIDIKALRGDILFYQPGRGSVESIGVRVLS